MSRRSQLGPCPNVWNVVTCNAFANFYFSSNFYVPDWNTKQIDEWNQKVYLEWLGLAREVAELTRKTALFGFSFEIWCYVYSYEWLIRKKKLALFLSLVNLNHVQAVLELQQYHGTSKIFARFYNQVIYRALIINNQVKKFARF